MNSNDIQKLLQELEQLMYGHNYQVIFRINYFNYCVSLDDFKRQFKLIYPDSNPDNVELSSVSIENFWKEINYSLDYRGDYGAGLELNNSQEIQLKDKQEQYKDCIKLFINEKSQIFLYDDSEGLPGFPVFWGYQYIIQTDYYKYLFIYGASSD